MNSSEVFHLWAHQAQDSARNSSRNVSFVGVSCYSYSVEIGRIVTNTRGEVAFLCYNGSRSSTTNRHKSEMSRAIPPESTVFTSCYLPPRYMGDSDLDYSRQLRYMIEELPEMKGRADRARNNKIWRLRELESHIELINSFAAFFDIPHTPITVDGIDDAIKEAEERNKAKFAEKEKRLEEARRKAIEKDLEELPRWLSGERRNAYWSFDTAYLRIRPSEPDKVETTMGAIVPLSHVRRIIGGVLASMIWCKGNNKPWVPIKEYRLGHYKINGVDANGILTVGCHRFTTEEIRRFARVLQDIPEDSETVPCE